MYGVGIKGVETGGGLKGEVDVLCEDAEIAAAVAAEASTASEAAEVPSVAAATATAAAEEGRRMSVD